MISNFLDIADMNLNSTVTRLLNDYNMKPILTRPQHHFFTDGSTYFEVGKHLHSRRIISSFLFCKCFRAGSITGQIDVDIHTFGYVARKALSMLRYISHEPSGTYTLFSL